MITACNGISGRRDPCSMAALPVLLVILLSASACASSGSRPSSTVPEPAPLTASPKVACTPPPPPAGCVPLGLEPIEEADLVVRGKCYTVSPGRYQYRYVNVVEGGRLHFLDEPGTIDFRVSSLLVEQGGEVTAGSVDCPFGSNGGHLDIGLWGTDPTEQGENRNPPPGIACVGTSSNPGACYPPGLTGATYCLRQGPPWNLTNPCDVSLPSAEQNANGNALFEAYTPLSFDYGENYFGYKVLAVSYGGSLQLIGRKGVADGDLNDPNRRQTTCDTPKNQYDAGEWAALSGASWARLSGSVQEGATSLVLDRNVNWKAGDEIVVGTTDWNVSHSELVRVTAVTTLDGRTVLEINPSIQYPHYGETYKVPPDLSEKTGNPNTAVDVRAAVGLLSRDITIYSLGATADEPFPSFPQNGETPSEEWRACGLTGNNTSTPTSCYFGGHVIARQGFGVFQVQGVELRQLGQGGRMGHYPVHFHLAKSTDYTNAFVKDSSVWDSMTRFVVLHGSQDVTVARNVGFLSMGHGYYMEDATEINNLFCHNLGVSARGSLEEYFENQDPKSPTYRFIPPILEQAYDSNASFIYDSETYYAAFGSDTYFPVMFWAMNQYNEFVGNKAVGVGGYGSCYWLLGSGVSGMSQNLTWTSNTNTPEDYANFNITGTQQAPLKRFRGNSCSTSAYALQTTFEVNPQPAAFTQPNSPPAITSGLSGFTAVPNPYLPSFCGFDENGCIQICATEAESSTNSPDPEAGLSAYCVPKVSGNYEPLHYLADSKEFSAPNCYQGVPYPANQQPPQTSFDYNPEFCTGSVIDRFTTSFNWAEVNFGAIWLRPWWYVFLNGAVTDQLFGGLGFVSGGSWPQVPPGYYAITRDSLFVGSSQPATFSPYAWKTGPEITNQYCNGSVCTLPPDGTGLVAGNLNPQRMITIYDGPFFADGNVFTAIQPFSCQQTPPNENLNACGIYSSTIQPQPNGSACAPTPAGDTMCVVDASIGWKQPNDFYYPPAFAFRKSGFEAGAFRHNVSDPTAGYIAGNPNNPGGQPNLYSASFPNNLATGLMPPDFSTILNDLDGTLTGLRPQGGTRTSAVSAFSFFDAPSQNPQCLSFGAQTSPFEFVTTVAAKVNTASAPWFIDDVSWNVSGVDPAVAIYRQMSLPRDFCHGDRSICCQPGTKGCKEGELGCSRGSFMMGAQAVEAPYLTANNGVYYVDTNSQGAPANGTAGSCMTSSANAVDPQFWLPSFTAGNTYVVYNLYANENTNVTYQVYVGPHFHHVQHGQWVYVSPHINNGNGNALWVNPITDPTVLAALNQGITKTESGVLQVVLDHSAIQQDYLFSSRPANQTCMPRDLCQPEPTPGGISNRCILQRKEDFYNPEDYRDLGPAIGDICEYWVTATGGRRFLPNTPGNDADDPIFADCGANGCLGYAFTLPSAFMPQPYNAVGAPLVQTCFPSQQWDVPMTSVDSACPAPSPPPALLFCDDIQGGGKK